VPLTPYVGVAAFKAHPTYLDLDGLRVGASTQAEQDAELNNILLMASGWADNEANQPLGAHAFTQQTRCHADTQGCLRWHSDHGPVVSVGTVGYGYSPTALTSIDGSGAWVENDTNIILPIGSYSGAWSGSLQFGAPASYGQMFVRSAVVAGFVSTVLGADALAGATSLTVSDPTGMVPGGTYRLWEPGVEETVTVASTWVPPAVGTAPATTAVALAAPTIAAHTAGADLSGMPSELRLAVTSKAVAMLMRPDVQVENSYPNAPTTSSIRTKSGKSSADYAADASRILASYGRVR
jgi:hypothetical protein